MKTLFRLIYLTVIFFEFYNSLEFELKTKRMVKLKENYLIECAFTLSFDENLIYLSLSKDEEEFYTLNQTNEDPIIKKIPGIESAEPISPGVLQIMNATQDSGGDYSCTISYTSSNGPQTTSLKNRISLVNETIEIYQFAINTKIEVGEDNTLICDFASSTYNFVISFAKDGKEFFIFDNQSKSLHISFAPGIDEKQIQIIENSTNSVKILDMTKEAEGTYRCIIKVPIPDGWYSVYDEKKVVPSKVKYLIPYSPTIYAISMYIYFIIDNIQENFSNFSNSLK